MSPLSVPGLTKRFGGVAANREVSFAVAPGELVGIIGPNGAGKSTLFDLITGFQRPTPVAVALDGRDITGLRPDWISRLGRGPHLSEAQAIRGMTALENVMVGAFQKTRTRGGAGDARAGAGAWASAAAQDAHARGLSTGQRKRLELARALATRPRLLLLDEVTGGVDQASMPGLVRLVRELHADGLALHGHRAQHARDHGHLPARRRAPAGPGHRRRPARRRSCATAA